MTTAYGYCQVIMRQEKYCSDTITIQTREKGGRGLPLFKVLIYMGKEIPGKDWVTGGYFVIVVY